MTPPSYCALCSGTHVRSTAKKHDAYELYECVTCKARFWWPLHFAGKAFYEIAEFNAAYTEGEADIYWRERQFLNDPPPTKGRLLEIGCGKGRFLSEARKLGFDAWGVDISAKAISIAKKLYGFTHLFAEDLSVFAERDIGMFDVICFFEVLEHQADPIQFLSLVKKLLKPDGHIALSVPNLSRIRGARQKEEIPPNHPFQFRPHTLRRLLESQGFRIESLKEEPFHKEFFFEDGGLLRFGILSFLRSRFSSSVAESSGVLGKKERRNDISVHAKERMVLRIFGLAGRIWKAGISLVLTPIVFVMRSLGYKWWDMYVFAKKVK